MATQIDYPLLTAEEFLSIDFGRKRAELDNGVIRMMAGAKARHNKVSTNIIRALGNRLDGSGCTPYGPNMATRTHGFSIRYPDVTVLCGHDGPEDDDHNAFDDPRVLFEILSAGTARTDLRTKLPEYQALPSVDAIVFVDTETERVRVVQRTGPGDWNDRAHREPTDVELPSLGITLLHAEIFAR